MLIIRMRVHRGGTYTMYYLDAVQEIFTNIRAYMQYHCRNILRTVRKSQKVIITLVILRTLRSSIISFCIEFQLKP